MKDFAIKKLYYSISEVSKMTDLKPYVLRYWETEFPELRPSKNRAGKRIYRNNDIKTILLIKKLLYTDKFTIEGARKRLKELHQADEEPAPLPTDGDRQQRILQELRQGLREILQLLERD